MSATRREKWRMRLWAAVVFIAAALEFIGLKRSAKGDTLSEYTWSKTKTPVMRGLVVGLVGWLLYHFSFGSNFVAWSLWDALSFLFGAALGVASAFRKPAAT